MAITRNYTLDIIRGLLLIIMTIDHFSYQIISYNLGYFSGATGFVFVSGLVMGIYGINKYFSIGLTKLRFNFAKRSLRIYKYHIFTLLFLFLLMLLQNLVHNSFALSTMASFDYEKFIWGILLVYQPNYLDILPMYIFFVLISPYVLSLIIKKKVGIILLVSLLLWLLNYIFIDSTIGYWFQYFQIPFKRVFSVLGWQFLFVLGMLTSSLYNSNRIDRFLENRLTLIISITLALLFFFQKNGLIEIIDAGLIETLAARDLLGPVILLNFLAVSHIVYYSLKIIDLKKYFNRAALLGKYSIQVFTFHTLLLIIFKRYIPLFSFEIFDNATGFQLILNNIFNWILTMPVIILLFIPVIIYSNQPHKLYLLQKLSEIKRYYYAFVNEECE